MSLILGAVSLLTLGFLSLGPFLLAASSVRAERLSDRGADSATVAGLWMSVVGTVLWLTILAFVHSMTADQLANGCSGGGCGGFPSSAWAETWGFVGWWVGVNAVLVAVVLVASSWHGGIHVRDRTSN
ncbi:MAG: hypothetical protein HY240_00025 [Actinobacteria bacterium]|nr:hypothetical protein [Actinomycetota bacterium]